MAKDKGIGLSALKASIAADSKIDEPEKSEVQAPPDPSAAEQTTDRIEPTPEPRPARVPKAPVKVRSDLDELLARLERSPKKETVNVRFPAWLNAAMVAHVRELGEAHDGEESTMAPTKQSLVAEAVLRLLHERGKL